MPCDHEQFRFSSSNPVNRISMAPNDSSASPAPSSFTMVKFIRYAVLAVLMLGAMYYVWLQPPSMKPIVDSRAAEALALVQTHRALGYPTILEAMTEHVRSMRERNLGTRLGEWRGEEGGGGLYARRSENTE